MPTFCLDKRQHEAIVLSVLMGVEIRNCQREKFNLTSLRQSLSVLQGTVDEDSAAGGESIREVLQAFSWLRILSRPTSHPIFHFAPALIS
jgi:hypothetical protein